VTSEHGSELSGSIKGEELHDRLIECLLLKKDSAPLSLFVCLFVCWLVGWLVG
jgi:hypothetical protein